MSDFDSIDRPYGSGLPVIHQGELAPDARGAFGAAMPYEPLTDRFALASVWLRVEERWPDGVYLARVTLRTAGWGALPGLPAELAADEDTEDAFLGMATRLPAPYVEHRSGACIQYDTGSFQREGRRAYRMDYRILGTPDRILRAVEELRIASDVRWKKAHMMLGYLPGGEDPSDERARQRIDRMYGPGTADAWQRQITDYDRDLGEYFQRTTVARIRERQPPG